MDCWELLRKEILSIVGLGDDLGEDDTDAILKLFAEYLVEHSGDG